MVRDHIFVDSISTQNDDAKTGRLSDIQQLVMRHSGSSECLDYSYFERELSSESIACIIQ